MVTGLELSQRGEYCNTFVFPSCERQVADLHRACVWTSRVISTWKMWVLVKLTARADDEVCLIKGRSLHHYSS